MSKKWTMGDYIRRTCGIYTNEAITKRLLEQGYQPDDIAHAWDLISSQSHDARETAQWQKRNGMGKRIVVVVIFWLLGFALAAGYLAFCQGLNSGTPDPIWFMPTNILFPVVEFGTLIGAILLVRKDIRPLQINTALTVITIVWLFVITGLCIRYFQGSLPFLSG